MRSSSTGIGAGMGVKWILKWRFGASNGSPMEFCLIYFEVNWRIYYLEKGE